MSTPSATPGDRLLLVGLFLTTLATLALEVLDARLLSVMAWYHLSFFAVSTAMFGMAAGALRVYLGGAAFEGQAARAALARSATWLAVSIPAAHAVQLSVKLSSGITVPALVAYTVTTVAMATPFFLSGVVVTIALTRSGALAGRAYAVDLLGAALGCLAIIPLFWWSNLTTAVVVCGAIAALAAIVFARRAGTSAVPAGLVAATLALLAVANAATGGPFTIWYVKDTFVARSDMLVEDWNEHSRVTVQAKPLTEPFYWAPGNGSAGLKLEGRGIVIDGDAGTAMSSWDGDPASLDWVSLDVTALPYHLRREGDALILGVGGGRDVLSALWARSRSVTGVEINDILLRFLQRDFREFTRIADRPEVELVHDEARSWLARTDRRFDVVQMSLIDTWASTAAGGFTLTENGLYTLEAFGSYLGRLKPGGIVSVSRWYDAEKVSEATRLLALGVAALLERGVEEPARHIAFVSRMRVATLLVSNEPLRAEDLASIERVAGERGFRILALPGRESTQERLRDVLASRSRADLDRAVADPVYDYSPPTDARPFFFNMLKPGSAFGDAASVRAGGVLRGNLQATGTLLLLAIISCVLVLAAILVPLGLSGRPDFPRGGFARSIAWFAGIGLAFMLVQIGWMQRLSLLLGHPTHALVAVLFTMIAAAGVGAYVSDRLPVGERRGLAPAIALVAGTEIAFAAFLSGPLAEHGAAYGLLARIGIAVLLVAPTAFVMGFFFPIGMRLVGRVSGDATAWMWGVNGAAGVLGSVVAVAISMWAGIGATLFTGAAIYALLSVLGVGLERDAAAVRPSPPLPGR